MEALWHISDPSSKNALASGLEDPSDDVRYYSVRGLAEITGEVQWGPSIFEFQEREQRYLNHWREWARPVSPH
jgi:HEAT repeat protein